jgi:hypothetical protein
MTSAPERAIAALTSSVFRALSAARGKRIFHPHGVGFSGLLVPTGDMGAEILRGRPREVILRLSRSVGLPESMRDPCGLSLRVPNAYGPGLHQDLLMVSSGTGRVHRHLLLPAQGFLDRPYSTLLPYRLMQRLVLIGAQGSNPGGPGSNPGGPGPSLAELTRRDHAGLEFDLTVATLGGDWRQAAKLQLGERLDDAQVEDLDLNPRNCGGGLELAGAINRLRVPAYRASQRGRGLHQ